MFKRSVELNNQKLLWVFEGCKQLSQTQGVKPLVSYRLAANVSTLRPFLIELEQEKVIILKDHCILDESGELVTNGNEYVFKSPEDRVQATKRVDSLYLDEKDDYKIWHFEASEVANESANIPGALWERIDPIIIDSEASE